MPRTNARNSLPPRPADAPWTASRCKRTLRQVTNFANRLERWHAAFLAAQEEGALHEGQVDNNSAANQTPSDWLSTTGKKNRPSKTYSSRNTRTISTSKPTPTTPLSKQTLARRAVRTPRNNIVASVPATIIRQKPPQQRRGHGGSRQESGGQTIVDNGAAAERNWPSGTAHLAQEHRNILSQGCSIMSTFLVSTANPTDPPRCEDGSNTPPRRGARSLFDISLDRISRVTVEQQKESDASQDRYDGRHDIIGSFFQEMEDFFGHSKTGWPPLRAAVRTCGIYMITRMMESGVLSEDVAIQFMAQWSSPLVADFQQDIRRSLLEAQRQTYDSELTFCHLPDDNPPSVVSPTQPLQEAMSIAWVLRALRGARDPVCVIERLIRFRNLSYLMQVYREPEPRPNGTIPQLLEAIFVTSVTTWGKTDRRALLRRGEHDVGEVCCSTISEATFNRLKHSWNAMLGLCMTENTSAAYRPMVERISKEVQALVELDVHLEMSDGQRGLAAHIFFGNLFQGLMHGRDADLVLLASLDSVLSDECFSKVSGSVIAMTLCMCAESRGGLRPFLRQLLDLKCDDYRRLNLALTKLGVETAQEYAVGHPEEVSNGLWTEEIIAAFEVKQQQTAAGVSWTPSRQLRPSYTWDASIAEWIAVSPSGIQNAGERTDSNSQVTACARGRFSRVGHVAVAGHHPLAPLSSNIVAVGADSQGRRRRLAGAETRWDGDFQYKRVKRVDRLTTAMMTTRQRTDADSEDELSLLG